MANVTEPQYPVAGRFNKDFKITSEYGYRVHPITKAKKHHNGVDLWGGKEPLKLEVWFDGVVIAKGYSAAGFGHYVVIRHKVYGKNVTSLYAHMKVASKLRKNQKVTAGTVVGIMGTTGASTGKHLHFEIGKGRTHPFISGGDGKQYYEPIKFVRSTIKKWEAEQELAEANAEAALATPAGSPASVVPAHSLPEGTVAAKPAAVKQKVVSKVPASKTK
jgi:murein DD-endopeptidase MepM/ murein hydrolase activator NlpD